MRSSSINQICRLRRRRLSRSIISDGPAVTDDMLVRAPVPVDVAMLVRTPVPVDANTPESTTSNDSVLVINEVTLL